VLGDIVGAAFCIYQHEFFGAALIDPAPRTAVNADYANGLTMGPSEPLYACILCRSTCTVYMADENELSLRAAIRFVFAE
jgi:hypothetical protein